MRSIVRGRVLLLLPLFVALFVVVAARFYYLQVQRFTFFQELARDQYEVEVTVPPCRGIIFDRSGKIPLSLNKYVTSAFTTPSNLKNRKELLNLMDFEFVGLSRSVLNDRKSHFAWLERGLDEEKLKRLKAYGCDDVYFVDESQRFYPRQDEACSVIGSVDIDGKGISGMELVLENSLSGVAQRMWVKRDARFQKGHYFERHVKDVGCPGENISISIDAKIQFLTYQEVRSAIESFGASDGGAVVIDPFDGQIYALVSISNQDQCDQVDQKRAANIVVSDCYELGSVIKPFAALAALDSGVTTTDELIDCEGEGANVAGFPVENWKPLGVLTFSDVVRRSSNVGIAKVACRLGHRLYDHYKRLGFGKKTGIEFPGERSGFVNPPKKWSIGSAQVLSFGYEMNATLLQLAKAMSVVANGGFDVKPTLLLEGDLCFGERIYKAESIENIKEILQDADTRYGTRWTVGQIPGFRIMGKTGTARCIKDGKYSENAHVYTFAGIVERGNYSRVIVVFIKEPERSDLYASQIAAPLFQRIATKVVRRDIVAGCC